MNAKLKSNLLKALIIGGATTAIVGVAWFGYKIAIDSANGNNDDVLNVDDEGNVKSGISNVVATAKSAVTKTTPTDNIPESVKITIQSSKTLYNESLKTAQKVASKSIANESDKKMYLQARKDNNYSLDDAVQMAREYCNENGVTGVNDQWKASYMIYGYQIYVVGIDTSKVKGYFQSIFLIDKTDGVVYDIWTNIK